VNLLVWLYIAPLLVILAVGALLTRRVQAAGERVDHPGRSHRPGLVARLQPAFGRISGCILVLAAGTGVIIALVWPVGYGARHFNAQDHKVYNWVLTHANAHWLHRAMSVLTKMSNNRETQVCSS
jgi:hypothetical protein